MDQNSHKNSRCFKVCSFNCRSVKHTLPEVQRLRDNHDLVALQEHWLYVKSYAAHADSLKTTGMVEKPKSHIAKKLPANRPVVGLSTSAKHLKSVVTKRSIDIFVSRLSPETGIDEVKTCVDNIVHGEFQNDIECIKLASRYENLYSSFYVSVTVNSRDMNRALELVNDAQSWPDGVLVRRYFKPKSNNG